MATVESTVTDSTVNTRSRSDFSCRGSTAAMAMAAEAPQIATEPPVKRPKRQSRPVMRARASPHRMVSNHRLRALGLKTYTQEEIRAQIAQAELEAHFRNDPDAAINASKKLGASFILRGLITTQTGINPVLKINEVAVHMGFTLVSAGGKTLSSVAARDESYSGTDTLGMALTLVNEQADEVVAKLYNDYCRAAGAK